MTYLVIARSNATSNPAASRSAHLGRFRKQRPKKRPFVTDEATGLFCKSHRLLDVWIGGSVLAVLFIGGEARKAEHRQSDVTCSFGRQKIAVMSAAEPRHQVKPHRAVSLEVGQLVQCDLVTQVTSNHPVVLQRKVEWALDRCANDCLARPVTPVVTAPPPPE